MRILLFSLVDTYESLIPEIEKKGHVCKLFTNRSREGKSIYLGGAEAVDWAVEEIHKFSPDVIVNNMPPLILPSSDNYTYFGNTRESANLELCKWETRQRAWECGFELPEVVAECNMHEMPKFPYTTFLKSKSQDIWCQAWKVTPERNVDLQNEMFKNLNGGISYPAYVERGMDFEVQAYTKFRISNNSYAITGIHGLHGKVDDYKEIDSKVLQDWRKNTWLEDLNPDQYKVFREKSESWLDYAVTLGGNYEGTIGGGITKDLEVYWFEQNSRLNTFEDFTGDVDLWIKSFAEKIDESFWSVSQYSNNK